MKLYTKTVCPKCMRVKASINDKELNCEYVNIDQNEDAKNLIIDKGFMMVPVLELNGEFIGDTSVIEEKLEELSE